MDRRVSGMEQECLLLKAKVKHDRGWPPNGWVIVTSWLFTHPEISPEPNSVQTQQKSFGWDYKLRPPVCIHMKKDHICVETVWCMSEFGELWKLQNKSIKTLQNAEVGRYMKEEERGLQTRTHAGLEMQNMCKHFHTKQLHMSSCTISITHHCVQHPLHMSLCIISVTLLCTISVTHVTVYNISYTTVCISYTCHCVQYKLHHCVYQLHVTVQYLVHRSLRTIAISWDDPVRSTRY